VNLFSCDDAHKPIVVSNLTATQHIQLSIPRSSTHPLVAHDSCIILINQLLLAASVSVIERKQVIGTGLSRGPSVSLSFGLFVGLSPVVCGKTADWI